MTIGDRIKDMRCAQHMTQQDLADAINTTKQTIYKYENNIITNIPIQKVEEIATVLDTTAPYLMGWSDSYTLASPIVEYETRPFNTSGQYYTNRMHESMQELQEIISIFEKLSPDNRAKLIELSTLYLNSQNKNE